ncbi:MAG: hypothetical protein S4CHLAM6_00130 [Chlamydiae bacterium]|nr:hypothetical protein [Chlamydiota bacterium]
MNISTATSPATSIAKPQFEVGNKLDVIPEIKDIVATTATQAVKEVATEVTKEAAAPIAAKKIHVCQGHTEFFHRYMKEKKAEKKAAKEVIEVQKDDFIKDASYVVISKKDHNGAKSGYFNGLNKIYNYAVLIKFSHIDDSTECPYHPANKA